MTTHTTLSRDGTVSDLFPPASYFNITTSAVSLPRLYLCVPLTGVSLCGCEWRRLTGCRTVRAVGVAV